MAAAIAAAAWTGLKVQLLSGRSLLLMPEAHCATFCRPDHRRATFARAWAAHDALAATPQAAWR